MSDSTQQYILASKPKIEMTDERIYFKLPWGEWWTSRKEHESDFVDIPTIEKQLEEIKDDLYGQVEYEAVVYGGQVEENAFEMHVKDAIYDALDQIKAVFGLENKETE